MDLKNQLILFAHSKVFFIDPHYTYAQSKIFHNLIIQKKKVSEEKLRNLGLKADLELYEFIERIQHMKIDGIYRIPWIIPYDNLKDITRQIKYKWSGD